LARGLKYQHLMSSEAVETITCALPKKPDACLAIEAYERNMDCDRSYAERAQRTLYSYSQDLSDSCIVPKRALESLLCITLAIHVYCTNLE